MPHFSYKAVGRDGTAHAGTIEAGGLEMASRQLRAQGLTLLKLESGVTASAANSASIGKPPGRQEILSMTSELAVLLVQEALWAAFPLRYCKKLQVCQQ